MTTNIRTYAAIMRRALPNTQVPETFNDQFYTADRAFILDLQKKLNRFLGIDGMSARLGDQGQPFPRLQETGTLDQNTMALILRLEQAAPQMDAKKIGEESYWAWTSTMSRFPDESGGFGTHIAAQHISRDVEKQVNDMKGQVATLRAVLDFHTRPDSDYTKAATANPVIGLKLALQQGRFTFNERSGTDTHLTLNNSVNDWQFALATKKLCRTLQESLNQLNELTGMPQIPVTGENLPAMHEAMEALLRNPEARERIENFDYIKRTWELYKQITPEQHRLMDRALDDQTKRFINIYATAQDAQIKNTGSKTLPDIRHVSTTAAYGTFEQDQLKDLETYIRQYEDFTIRDTLKAVNPGAWDATRSFFGGDYHDGIKEEDIEFAVNFREHFLEVRALRQAQLERKDFVPPSTPHGEKLFELQRHLLTKSREIYESPEVPGFFQSTMMRMDPRGRIGKLVPETFAEYQQLYMLKLQDIQSGLVPPPSLYDTPLNRVDLDGRTGNLALTQNMTEIMLQTQGMVMANLSNPAFAAHIISQTGFSRADLLKLAPGDINPDSIKLLRAMASYQGEIRGVNPEMKTAISLAAGLSDAQLREIHNAPVAALASRVKDMTRILGISFTESNPPVLNQSLSESYAYSIEQYQRLIRGKAGYLSGLHSQLSSLPEEARVILDSLAKGLKQAFPDRSDQENLRYYFENFPPREGVIDYSRLSGNPTDPTVALSRVILSLKDKYIRWDDPLMKASWFVNDANAAIATMTPAQRLEMERLLVPHDIRKHEPLIREMKTFIRDNIVTLNRALPADKQITASLTINSDFRDPAFLRAFNVLGEANHAVLMSDAIEKLESFRERLAPMMPYLAPRALAAEMGGGNVRFESDAKAVEAMPLLVAKRSLSQLAGNTIFQGIPAFNPATDLLNSSEIGFVTAYESLKTHLPEWIAALPQEIMAAAALSVEEIEQQMQATLQAARPEDRTAYNTACIIQGLGAVTQFGVQVTAEDLATLPEGSYTLDANGLHFDPAKLDANAITTLQTLLDTKKAAIPQGEAKQVFDNIYLETRLGLAGRMGLISEHEMFRLQIGNPQLPPAAYLAALTDAVNDPRFTAKLGSTIGGVPKEEYLKNLRSGVENITAALEALDSSPQLVTSLDNAVIAQQEAIEQQRLAEQRRIQEEQQRALAEQQRLATQAAAAEAERVANTPPPPLRLQGNFALQVASLPRPENAAAREAEMRSAGTDDIWARNGQPGTPGQTGGPEVERRDTPVVGAPGTPGATTR